MVVAQDEWISIPEAMRRFHLSRNTLSSAIDRGVIAERRRELGKERRFVNAREVERKLTPQPPEQDPEQDEG
jgi:hypothetical protein